MSFRLVPHLQRLVAWKSRKIVADRHYADLYIELRSKRHSGSHTSSATMIFRHDSDCWWWVCFLSARVARDNDG